MREISSARDSRAPAGRALPRRPEPVESAATFEDDARFEAVLLDDPTAEFGFGYVVVRAERVNEGASISPDFV